MEAGKGRCALYSGKLRINMPNRRSEAAVTQFLRDALAVDALGVRSNWKECDVLAPHFDHPRYSLAVARPSSRACFYNGAAAALTYHRVPNFELRNSSCELVPNNGGGIATTRGNVGSCYGSWTHWAEILLGYLAKSLGGAVSPQNLTKGE